MTETLCLKFVRGHIDDTSAKMRASLIDNEKDDKRPMVQRMLQHHIDSGRGDFCVQDIVSECMGHLYVGTSFRNQMFN